MDPFELLKERIEDSLDQDVISATNFHQVRCPVCDDYKVRAGFKFSHNEIVYNCFRGKCDASSVLVKGEEPSYKFKKVMHAFGVHIPEELLLLGKSAIREDPDLFKKHKFKDHEVPDNFYYYRRDRHPEIAEILDERCVESEEFYVKKVRKGIYDLVFPCFFYNKLIGWQIYDTRKREYRTFGSHVFYSPSGILAREPVLVEGVFDALVVPNGVALFKNHITREQAYFFKNLSPILLPDRKDSDFLDVAKLYQWRISIPSTKDWSREKDANEYAQHKGRLVLARVIHEGIKEDIKSAKTDYELWRQ